MKHERNILEEHIMQRIYLMWFGRYLKRSRLVRLVILLTLIVLARFWVSFGNVFENIQTVGFTRSLSDYVTTAVVATEPIVQIITAVFLFLLVLFLIDAGKAAFKGFRLRATM